MLINVATLLQEPIGHARQYFADGEAVSVPEEGYEQTITGPIRVIRSERGVLVTASFDLDPVELECSRCLETYLQPVHIEFDEEYVAYRDPVTGLRPEVDEDEFRIDQRWHLDLSEAVRQYEQSALPIQPVCRPDCRGLCPTCGQHLNEATCGCAAAVTSDKWSPLSGLAERLQLEERHGSPEA